MTLRYFNVAGATDARGEDHDPETHLIPAILAAAERAEPLTLFGDDYPTPDGTCVRDYIHVADLADAHLRAIEATAAGDPRTADAPLVCNLGNGGGFSEPRGHPRGRGRRRPRRSRTRSGRGGSAIRRCSWRQRTGRGRCSAGGRDDPTLEEMVGSAWAWRQAHPGGYPD